jgi:hypothetical protein
VGREAVEQVSQNARVEASGSGSAPQISADGVWWLSSPTTNLVPETTTESPSLCRTLPELVTRLASGSSIGRLEVRPTASPTLSADGAVVAFLASDGELVPDDRNGVDVFAREERAAVRLVSVADVSLATDGGSAVR